MRKNEYIGFAVAILLLIAVLAVFRSRISTAQAIEIIITFALVLITVVYVKRTAEISKANTKMDKEAERARFAAFQPILTIDECLTTTDKIQIGLVIESGDLPQYYPCNIIIGLSP